MGYSPEQQIELLTPAIAPVQPEDSMAEAGRKILLAELVKMLEHENGSRTGKDIEDVHDMRVATRRMRSAIRLLKPYFKAKDIRVFNRHLRRLAWALGDVRDLDVMIEQLGRYQAGLEADRQAALQPVIDELDRRRQFAREELNAHLDSKTYRRFVKSFTEFLTQPVPEARPAHDGEVTPFQVRHVLPLLISERLAAVRAYDTILPAAEPKTLHMLRIEFKRLRYVLSLFQDVLGAQAKEVIEEIKTIQDHLGHLNDSAVARARLEGVVGDETGVLDDYLAFLETQEIGLRDGFPVEWARFNSRKVQQKLATAVLALR
jgi:CHAD domain-containing protein